MLMTMMSVRRKFTLPQAYFRINVFDINLYDLNTNFWFFRDIYRRQKDISNNHTDFIFVIFLGFFLFIVLGLCFVFHSMKITKSLKGSRKLSDFDQIFLFFVMYEHEVRLYGFRKFYCHSLWYTSLGAPQQQRLTHAVFIFLFYLAKIVLSFFFRQHAQFFFLFKK